MDRSEIIRNNPIGEGLEAFLTSFARLCETKEITWGGEVPDQLDQLGDEDVRDLVYELLSALWNLRTSRQLPSSTGHGSLRTDFLDLEASFEREGFDYKCVKPLLKAVVAKKSNEEIWDQVYHILVPSTPLFRPILSNL
ncbi:uncharacterized protein F4822DRAFT_404952 [Hypoxylon trugodes]|uniref:uncharacterized protein n=1 Tax=Hypoxylon trugodes TaxID=326681 RepID=UPI00218CCC4F|nr:uncharacterized protein F4822DRAFT_404952 [Hypoxylon trugodes]KAI1389105.1 hypothetical protein F4822DRAFT_404952 [Hypoxylon trugodes]